MKVAIIGSGPSGLAAMTSFAHAAQKGTQIPEVVCFEKNTNWGGQWNQSWRTGTDQNGEPVTSSMYHDLWSNGPKELLEMSNYSFEEHFGKPIGSYPPRAVLADYILGRAEKAGVKKWIRFENAVRSVRFLDNENKFEVISYNHPNKQEVCEKYDYVINAAGHFSVPHVPTFEGLDSFKGLVIHAHDFRDGNHYKGLNVLCVGASYSAEDIALQCVKFGAKSVTTSWRSQAMGYEWPENMKEVPLFLKVEGKTAHFKDGSTKEIDAIILCTGYQYYFPYMHDSLRLQSYNRYWIENLYQGTVWVDCPKLFYLGMHDQIYTFTMFDAQAWYVRDVILGKIKLPSSKAEMLKEGENWAKREGELKNIYDQTVFQGDYVEQLTQLTDYPTIDSKATNECVYEWLKNKKTNILTYRNQTHKSVITGNMQVAYKTPWIEAFDDSIDAFLKGEQQSAKL